MSKSLLITVSLWLAASVGIGAAGLEDGPVHTLLWNDMEAMQIIDERFAVAIADDAVVVCRYNENWRRFVVDGVTRTDYRPVEVRRQDSLLVVTTRDDRLVFYNLQHLPELKYLWTIEPGMPFADYAFNDKHIYFSSWFDGIWQFTHEEGGIRFVDSSMIGIIVTQLQIEQDTLYALDVYNGIMRYDLGVPGFGDFIDYLYVHEELVFFVKSGSEFVIKPKSNRVLFGEFGLGRNGITDSLASLGHIDRMYVMPDRYLMLDPRSLFVVDRVNHAVEGTVSIEESLVDGDLFSMRGQPHLVLPRKAGGLHFYDLTALGVVRAGLYRSGPIENLVFRDRRLITGGGANPLDVYSFDSTATPTYEYTMYDDLYQTQNMLLTGDTLLLYLAGVNKVAFLLNAFDPDSFFVERSFFLDDTLAGEMLLLPNKIDTFRVLLTAGESEIQPHTISDSGLITSREPWKFHGRIRDFTARDSMLFVATSKNVLWIYAIAPDLQLDLKVISDLEGTVHEMVWLDSHLAVFVDNNMYVYHVSESQAVERRYTTKLALSVWDVAAANGVWYAVGPEGVGVFNLEGTYPELTSLAPGGGTMIAVDDDVLVTSDGGSIEVYRLEEKSGPLTPVPEPEPPHTFAVSQNYPNPFNSGTTVKFSLQETANVRLTVYNVLGRQVQTLVDGSLPAGDYQVYWDGADVGGNTVSTGIYFYRFEAGDVVETRKMVMLK